MCHKINVTNLYKILYSNIYGFSLYLTQGHRKSKYYLQGVIPITLVLYYVP